MKYFLTIVAAFAWYFLIGWIAKDIYFANNPIEDSTIITQIVYSEVLVQAIVATIWLIGCLIFYRKGSNESDLQTYIYVGSYCGIWLMYYAIKNSWLPITDGTFVLNFLVSIICMIAGSCAIIKTNK